MDNERKNRSLVHSEEFDRRSTELVYHAQEEYDAIVCVDVPTLTRDNIERYLVDVAREAGWQGVESIDVQFDIPDDSNSGGACTGNLGSGEMVLHFHPRLLRAEIALHELAHYLRPNDGHGPQFCAVLIGLHRFGIGISSAIELASAFVDVGLDICPDWLEGFGVIDLYGEHGPRADSSVTGAFMDPSPICARYQPANSL